MHRIFWRLVATALVAVMVVSAYSDDTSSSPTGPLDDKKPVVDGTELANSKDDEAAVFYGELNQAMAGVIPMLLLGGGELQGSGGGRIVIEGTTLTFEDYSPDGEIAMTGVTTSGILKSRWNTIGTLILSGANDGEVVGAMTLDPLTNPLAAGITVAIDWADYDVAELFAQIAQG